MKHLMYISLFLAIVFSTTTAQIDTLTILFASDTHSNLAPIGSRTSDLKGTVGGIARAATLIGMTKMAEPNVLVLHGGDVMIGDIFYNTYFGIAELQIMKMIGYDVMTLGNHEFDLGPITLQTALDSSMIESPLSIVSSNIIIPDTSLIHLQKYINQCTVKQIGAIKVGIFGLTTPETNLLSNPVPVQFDQNIPECAVRMVDSLKHMGCSVIICLSHLGIGVDTSLAVSIPGIDLFIGAHDHLSRTAKEFIDPLGKKTWVAQSNAFYTEMGKIQLRVSSTSTELISSTNIPLDKNIPEEPTVAEEVAQLIAGVEALFGPIFSQRVGYATDFFNEVPKNLMGIEPKETAIGNLVTDAFREYTKTDIAIEPGGSTAQPLFKGPIVADDLFRVVGYGFNEKNYLGFRLVTFFITGESLYIALEKCLANSDANDEFFPQVSGMTFSCSMDHQPGTRINWVKINGQPVDPVKRYSVTTNELAVTLLTTLLEINLSDITLLEDVSEYQALLAYVSKKDTITPSVPGRITGITVNRNELSLPHKYYLSQNYPNPFNPITMISFELPAHVHAVIKVYDVVGKEIATLVDDNLQAGTYSVPFNAQQYASGLYFYTLNAENFHQTKKMLLVK